jgi:glycosyltransferase involved in cell wall biosynthesis
MRIVLITAGAAGMYCGSCLRDNTLVTALGRRGHDALLLPTYTPITTDEPLAKSTPIFMGGVNVYLQEKVGLFRHTPRWLDSLLDNNRFLKWVGRFASRTNYADLGGLLHSMLLGDHGHQKKEVLRLAAWLKSEIQPEVIILTNVLLSGLVPTLKRELGVPIVATLQGDDIFLDALREEDRRKCVDAIRVNSESLAGLISTSTFYADHMSGFLGIPRDRIHVIPPGIQLQGHGGPREANPKPVIGFFARIAPEKGLHNLVDAFVHYRQTPGNPPAQLKASGWLGEQHKGYLETQRKKLQAAGLAEDFEYIDSPGLKEKVRFLNQVDVLSVPTDYREPKGLYVLEAWANGTPVVLPEHGCFPELVRETGGGILVEPKNAQALSEALSRLTRDVAMRNQMGNAGRNAVTERFTAETMAVRTEQYLKTLLSQA